MFPEDDHLEWRASSRCATNACVEVAASGAWVLVRDSVDAAGPHLTVSREAWASFLRRIRAGELDWPT